MRKFKADYIFPINAEPVKNGIVTVNSQGEITAIESGNLSDEVDESVEVFEGIICPGFINTHCHLELSHLKNKIPSNNGLVQFIKDVQQMRQADESDVLAAAEQADQEMYENGIVAVGDISNTTITAEIKAQSKIYYHTFVETFGFTPENAAAVFDRAVENTQKFKPSSISPHAPYSVSKDLFKLLKKHGDANPEPITIHNQETEDENKLFRYKTGQFVDLYKSFGINIDFFKPQARNSLQSVIPLLSSKPQILLVHNTFTNLKDIYFVKRFDRKISWCFCPNANLYIENRLPKIDLFLDQDFNFTLGTDSLASNQKLSILDEMYVLQQNFPQLGLSQLLGWATINGAKFLEISQEKGSIEVGKTPGLNLITGLDDFKLTAESQVKRLI